MIDKNPEIIQNMFDEIAEKYDFNNNIISLGLHKKIKEKTIQTIEMNINSIVLDLCCGTGDISYFLSKKKEVEKVIGVDFSKNMLKIANEKNKNDKIDYIFADCTKLPFSDNSFDAITMCFGLRNIENIDTTLKEIQRVLKPNGLFLHMDFAKGNRILDKFFDIFVPIGVKLFYGNSIPYSYLIQSKQEFYTPNELEKLLKKYNLNLFKEKNYLFSTISTQIYIKDFSSTLPE